MPIGISVLRAVRLLSQPRLLALHGLGGNARTFGPLREELSDIVNVAAIDLPGFGSLKDAPNGGDLEVMTNVARNAVAQFTAAKPATANASSEDNASAEPWFLLGHSMGGKIAVTLASEFETAAHAKAARAKAPQATTFAKVRPPSGIILLAPSPATPEPMSEEKRSQLLADIANGLTYPFAEQFIADDCAGQLSKRAHEIALETITNSSPTAWQQWLTRGSRIDISEEVGTITIPTLVIGGDQDTALGAAAQPDLQAATLAAPQYVTLTNTGHQLPLERPAEVAAAIRRFIASIPTNFNR